MRKSGNSSFQNHTERIGHGSPSSQTACILDHSLDPCSTQAFIRRKRWLSLRDVSQAVCQDDGVLHRQRGALSGGGRDSMDGITGQHHRALAPEGLGRDIVDGVANNALGGPNDLAEDGLLLSE